MTSRSVRGDARTPPATDDVARLAQACVREIKRLQRRLRAIQRDIDRASVAAALQHQAELLTHQKLPRRGAREVTATDYGVEPPTAVVITLDPAREPREQVDAWFKTARRYLRGAELGRTRWIETQHEIDALERIRVQVAEAQDAALVALPATLSAEPVVIALLGRAHPQRTASAKPEAAPARRPFREFVGYGGAAILVGRGAKDNDMLTTRIARPQDVFLHVQGATGAHVIVPRNKNETLPAELLVDAATLAHHFSSVVADGRSDVAYTERRHVQKRRGTPAGAVHLLRHKVLHLVYDKARASRLIAGEVRLSDG